MKTKPIPIKDISGKMMNLHNELGEGETEDGQKIRFTQHINGACFWLSIGSNKLYQLDTQDIMTAMHEAVREEQPNAM